MAVGSHHLPRSDGKFIYHRESVDSICVPPNFCVTFHHSRTVHGGGQSNKLNVRFFSMYGPTESFGCTQSQNYLREVRLCNLDCCYCLRIAIHRF